jgi:hypothetical protein
MVKFSAAAKLTQARYGTSSQPAIFELRKKANRHPNGLTTVEYRKLLKKTPEAT